MQYLLFLTVLLDLVFILSRCFVGWVIDWFRMPCLVRTTNARRRRPLAYPVKSTMDAYVMWFPFGLIGAFHCSFLDIQRGIKRDRQRIQFFFSFFELTEFKLSEFLFC